MSKNIRLIYLDEYSEEFRLGYDAANVTCILRELIDLYFTHNKVQKRYLTIHKNSLSLCQGLCAENMFYSDTIAPDDIVSKLKSPDEVWIMIVASKMLK